MILLFREPGYLLCYLIIIISLWTLEEFLCEKTCLSTDIRQQYYRHRSAALLTYVSRATDIRQQITTSIHSSAFQWRLSRRGQIEGNI